MNKGAMLMMLLVLALMGYGELLAGPHSEGRVRSSGDPPTSSPAQGTTKNWQVTPNKGEFPPSSELTPEQIEQMLRRTMRKVEEGQCSDANPPNPGAR